MGFGAGDGRIVMNDWFLTGFTLGFQQRFSTKVFNKGWQVSNA
jgi:hypothetical protein